MRQSPEPLVLFHSVVLDVFDRAFPLRWIKHKARKKKPWLTEGLRVSARNLRCLNNIKKFFPNNPDFVSYCNGYRSIYRRLVKVAKERHYSSRLSEAKNKQKESWSIVGEVCNRSTQHNCREIDVDPNTLNSFYCSVAGTLTDKIATSGNPLKYLAHVSVADSFAFTPVLKCEIYKALGDIKHSKSCGDDEISCELLRALPDDALEVLAFGIDDSWLTGRFPSCLKSAKVIPLHKGGDRQDPSNYRPISLLSTVSKVIEMIVKGRIWSFLKAIWVSGFLGNPRCYF
jgi:hypothetical protein